MSSPLVSENFGDLLDPRFQKIFSEKFDDIPDMLPQVYNMIGSNGRDETKFSDVGAFGDLTEFAGTVAFDSFSQGFDTTVTPLEFTSGFQISRKLFDDNQFPGVFDNRPAGLARATMRTKQKDGARIFNNAFSVDTRFYVNSEGVALCSDSHISNHPGVDTSAGFDNLTTTGLSATAVIAARKQMVRFRDDRANFVTIEPNELWIPTDLFDVGLEIANSMGKPDTAENTINVLNNSLQVKEWVYLTDSNNWFMVDSGLREEMAVWEDRISPEFAMVEDFDTLIAKWRVYARWAQGHLDWRWIVGAQVS